MESYDVVMFVIVGIMILVGAWKGLAWQIAIVASIIVSFWVAISFEKSLADLLTVIDAPWNSYIAMILLYLGTSLGIWFLFACSARFIEKLELKGFDRQMGAIIGVVNGILVCCVLTLFASMCGNEKLDTSLTRSKSAVKATAAATGGAVKAGSAWTERPTASPRSALASSTMSSSGLL